MKHIVIILLAAVAIALNSDAAYSQKSVSLGSLLTDMIDRDVAARFPSPEFTCAQFSSYDPASVSKDAPGWFANEDFNQFIRLETTGGRSEFVMMETEGPGAIVRFWMTFANKNRGNGILRIYLDGSDTPVIEGTAFDILSGGKLVGAPLSTSVSELTPYGERGHNLYLPVPYAKSCKVTYQCKEIVMRDGKPYPGSENIYYNINYRTYPKGTPVTSFSTGELTRNAGLLDKVQRELGGNYRSADHMKLSHHTSDVTLQPGDSSSFTISGSKAIRSFSVKIGAGDLHQALRSTVLSISFDGNKCVWVPLGEFFGTSYRNVVTDNWYTSCHGDGGMKAYWVMPFAKECRITMVNHGGQPVEIASETSYGPWKWDSRSMHFGAAWHQYTGISTRDPDTPSGGHIDINFTELLGKGVYLGDGISIFNTTSDWWGEGDEKIYVDGEKSPSHFGTGTEDYYGYAWCMPSVFIGHPFIAQPVGKGSFEPALSINTRFRSLDVIPFHKSLVFDMELWHWQHCLVNYAPVTFWYMLPGGRTLTVNDMDNVKAPVAEKKRDVTDRGLVKLSFEGENMSVDTITGGSLSYQFHPRWSNNAQVFWTGVTPGDRLTLSFRTGAAGTFDASCQLTTAADYGPVNIYVNGRPAGKAIDLLTRDVLTKTVRLGEVELQSGLNTVTIELVGLPVGFERSMAGIDRIMFEE